MQIAIAADAGFVARAFTGHKEQLISLMKQAIQYKGYALVDILQPCVSFNKVNTFAWYNSRVYELEAATTRRTRRPRLRARRNSATESPWACSTAKKSRHSTIGTPC